MRLPDSDKVSKVLLLALNLLWVIPLLLIGTPLLMLVELLEPVLNFIEDHELMP